jgi:hypothetical protein
MPTICWADRLTLLLMVPIYFVVYMLGRRADYTTAKQIFDMLVELGLGLFLPIWVALRLIDLVMGGPWTRRSNGPLRPGQP